MKIGLKNNVLRVTHKRKRVESNIDSELEEAALCLISILSAESISLLDMPLEYLCGIKICPPTEVGNKYINVLLNYSGTSGVAQRMVPVDVTDKSWLEIIDYTFQLIRVIHILSRLINKLKNKLNNGHV